MRETRHTFRGTDVHGRMAQDRGQRRGDTVDLVKVVVGKHDNLGDHPNSVARANDRTVAIPYRYATSGAHIEVHRILWAVMKKF